MPRKFFRRFSPHPHDFRRRFKVRGARFVESMMEDTNLFHLTRHSISLAFFSGIFIAFIPFIGQIPLAILAAFLLRANLPITLLLICVSNPFTFPVIFFSTYKLGAFLMDVPARQVPFELSFQWIGSTFMEIWKPLLLGSLLTGLFFACLSYVMIHLIWRVSVIIRWRERKEKRQLKKEARTRMKERKKRYIALQKHDGD